MASSFSKFYDYFEEKWLLIPFEFRMVILVSTVLVLLMLTLYLYFFNTSIFEKLFCYRLCRRRKRKRERGRSKPIKEGQAANEDEEGWANNPENERYCDKFNGEKQFESQKSSFKAKRPPPRADSFKAVPSVSASVSEIKSELDGNNSFMNQDFNQQVKQRNDNLIENIHKYKEQLNTNIKLVHRQSSAAKVPAAPSLRRSFLAARELEQSTRPTPSVSPKSEYNLIRIVNENAENDPVKETNNKFSGPRKIEFSPGMKPATDSSVYSGLSQHLQESVRTDEPEPKRLSEDEKKHSAFSSFN